MPPRQSGKGAGLVRPQRGDFGPLLCEGLAVLLEGTLPNDLEPEVDRLLGEGYPPASISEALERARSPGRVWSQAVVPILARLLAVR